MWEKPEYPGGNPFRHGENIYKVLTDRKQIAYVCQDLILNLRAADGLLKPVFVT